MGNQVLQVRLIMILIFGALSLIMIAVAMVLVWRTAWVLRVGRRVRGQCVDVFVDPTSLNTLQDQWFCVVAFDLPGGGRHRTKVETRRYALGERIPVIVSPNAPDRALVEHPWLLWRIPIVLGLVTIVFVAATVGLLSLP